MTLGGWWVTDDYHGQCSSSSGDYHYHMIIIHWCPSSGDDYYLSHGYHLMMTVTWCKWLSPDVDDCHLMMMGIMGDENHSNDYHWAMSTNGWWESPSDEDLHWWWLPLRVKIMDCWHTLGGNYHWMMVMVDGYHRWVSSSNDGHWLLAVMVDEYYRVMVVTSFWWAPSGNDHSW